MRLISSPLLGSLIYTFLNTINDHAKIVRNNVTKKRYLKVAKATMDNYWFILWTTKSSLLTYLLNELISIFSRLIKYESMYILHTFDEITMKYLYYYKQAFLINKKIGFMTVNHL